MRPMTVPTFKVGDRVKMRPESAWRGVITQKHPHRANGFKVQTVVPHGTLCAETFWVRPISIQLDEESQL